MKIALRVLIGVVILVAIVLGINQFPKGGVQEVSSNSTPAPQKIGDTFTSAEYGYSHRIRLVGKEDRRPVQSGHDCSAQIERRVEQYGDNR